MKLWENTVLTEKGIALQNKFSAGLVGVEQHKKLSDAVKEIRNRINELSAELNKKADSAVVSQGLAGKANQTDLNTLSSQVSNVKNMKIVTGNGPITVGPYGNADTWVNFPSTFSSPPIVIICNAYSSYSRGLAAVDITKTGFNARGSNMGSGTTTFYYSYVAIGK